MAEQLLAMVKSIAEDRESTKTGDVLCGHTGSEPNTQVSEHTDPEDTPSNGMPPELAFDELPLDFDDFPDHATHFAAGGSESEPQSVTSQDHGVNQDYIQNHADALDPGFPQAFLSTLLNDERPSMRASTATDDDYQEMVATCEEHDAAKTMEGVHVSAEMTSDQGTVKIGDGGGYMHDSDQHILKESMAATARYVAEYMNLLAALIVQLVRLTMSHLLSPIFLGEFGKLTFWILFTVYAVPWALRTHTVQTVVRNVVCETPVIGYVARLEGMECPGANVTQALTMYANAQDTWQQLQGPVLELLPLSSLFTLAHNRLEDASFVVRYGRYPGCGRTADAIESYAANVSSMGWRLEKYFHNITLVTEIMAINLDRAVSIMREDAEAGLLQRLIATTAKPDINVALAGHINYAEEALSSLYHEGQTYPEFMENLHKSWKLVEHLRQQDMHSVETELEDSRRARQTWFVFPRRPPSPREERFEAALVILQHLKDVYSDDARKSIQQLTLHLKNILLDLDAAQEVMLTAGRYVTNKTHVEHLQYRLAGLWGMSIALRQRHTQFSTDLIQDIKRGRGTEHQ
ncbi:hypothetical protein EDD36DRAFT_325276 [Exophiala viscosa]|uniref:Uncharacterized protein n=1 Tax=Exophiala viscosa TaxID=2486360 RepID=A0AAN6DQJ9_9EURO|nr:hypothetical protein EDD36DRAFT_325276 [Exophiala viscosa]